MPIVERIELGSIFDRKFVRVLDQIHVGLSEFDGHGDIAEEDELLERIDALKTSNPTELDAGFLGGREEELHIYEESTTLHLPLAQWIQESREKTRNLLQAQNPGHIVIVKNKEPI